MKEIIFLQGLPASGKSTWSKQFCIDNPQYIRLNKDDIREELGNPPFSYSFEKIVLEKQRQAGNMWIKQGFSLVIDDTNFAEKHRNYWEKIASDNHYKFTVKTFNTPVDECITRDSLREKSVGKDVILGMYNKYLKNEL